MPASITRTVALALGFALTAMSAVPNYPLNSDVPAMDKVLLDENPLPNCMAHYTVSEADTCMDIVNMHPNTLNLNEFYLWNPMVKRDCSNLIVGETLCIRARTLRDCGACSAACAPCHT
ncbi:uncharacterized protein N7498_007168 [Penicillium cinerascens]|uniref:LysM domain-containing protein n=1 Tax=Penicillium cinerascens TaxID=70096 RepID=A0A9W9JL29_9EURO|nr:uncharacterized protein N7498_007168 [Penicillium cinerascens]KAJ5198051.1 hypothetical protein N7498_007168 [Penicillium cinerascens]